MRTTVTLDPDVAELLRRLMTEQGLTFKEAVNSAIRSALTAGDDPFRDVPLPAFDMGEPRVPLEHALRLAADLADEEIARNLAGGK